MTTDSLPSPGLKATVFPSTALTSENFGAVAPMGSSSAAKHAVAATPSKRESNNFFIASS